MMKTSSESIRRVYRTKTPLQQRLQLLLLHERRLQPHRGAEVARSAANGNLTQSASFGDYQVTVSINALSGKTANDTYFYCSTVVIEPAG